MNAWPPEKRARAVKALAAIYAAYDAAHPTDAPTNDNAAPAAAPAPRAVASRPRRK